MPKTATGLAHRRCGAWNRPVAQLHEQGSRAISVAAPPRIANLFSLTGIIKEALNQELDYRVRNLLEAAKLIETLDQQNHVRARES
jgi:hypothetical protein